MPSFYSPAGSENVVTFEHYYLTDLTNLGDVSEMSADERGDYLDAHIEPLMKFLFGPSTRRGLGGPQRDEIITADWNNPTLVRGRVAIPFRYKGVWILGQDLAARGKWVMPVPVDYNGLFTPAWKRCTDWDPDHATPSFLWYFWDPARGGCDHKKGIQYEDVTLFVGSATRNEPLSYPEYSRMIREVNGRRMLSMTVAFGYVKDRPDPNPDTDPDEGANEYRTFLRHARTWAGWTETPILMREYEHSGRKNTVVGRRFTAEKDGVQVTLNVVINAGLDQILLFGKSFAHDHDSFFAWMGHSRVGNGFDAAEFRRMLQWHPEYYSISRDYQLVYWGGCNSYSYYTLPFFKFKSEAFPEDRFGTRGLDIIAHGLPSYFILNAVNAEAVTTAVLNWQERRSYQAIVQAIEGNGSYIGSTILAAVLGDEDNPQ